MSRAISLDHVSKRYMLFRQARGGFKEWMLGLGRGRDRTSREFWALSDVSFEVGSGETVAILGHNGSGKSTLLQLIAGILEPDGGSVDVRGRVTSLLELGAGFSPELSGRENVYLNASLHGFSRRDVDRFFDAVVEFSEIEPFIDMPVRTYSSGMYMRLAMGVAVHLDPEIVLIDEAFAVGDESFQRKCMAKLKSFQDAGVTVVIVTHDAQLAERMAREGLLLDHGRVAARGPVGDVVARYHRQSAGLDASAEELRWGSREIVIDEVVVRDAAGQAISVARTGDALEIVMAARADAPVRNPVFGLGISRDDGAHVTGPNTRMNGFPIDTFSGRHRVVFRIPALPLLPGQYYLSVSAYDYHLVHAYDHRERVAPLRVVEGGTDERFGLVTVNGDWRFEPFQAIPAS